MIPTQRSVAAARAARSCERARAAGSRGRGDRRRQRLDRRHARPRCRLLADPRSSRCGAKSPGLRLRATRESAVARGAGSRFSTTTTSGRRDKLRLQLERPQGADWCYAGVVVVDESLYRDGAAAGARPPWRSPSSFATGPRSRRWRRMSSCATELLPVVGGFDEALSIPPTGISGCGSPSSGRRSPCDELLVATLDHPRPLFFRDARDIRAEIEVVLHRAGGDDADRQAVDEWFANELYRGGHRGLAARRVPRDRDPLPEPGQRPAGRGRPVRRPWHAGGLRRARAGRLGNAPRRRAHGRPPPSPRGSQRSRESHDGAGAGRRSSALGNDVGRGDARHGCRRRLPGGAGQPLPLRVRVPRQASARAREYPRPARAATRPGTVTDYDALWRRRVLAGRALAAGGDRRQSREPPSSRAAGSRRVLSGAGAPDHPRPAPASRRDAIAVPERRGRSARSSSSRSTRRSPSSGSPTGTRCGSLPSCGPAQRRLELARSRLAAAVRSGSAATLEPGLC